MLVESGVGVYSRSNVLPDINISHQHKVIWWLPTRNGTRSVGLFLSTLLFEKQGKVIGPEWMPTHTLCYPDNIEGYSLYLNVRNPYSRVLSFWHWHRELSKTDKRCLDTFNTNFSDYVSKANYKFLDDPHYETILKAVTTKKKIKANFVKLENLKEDILKIPFIDIKSPAILNNYNKYIINNQFLSADTDYRLFYTEETAQLIYNEFKEAFTMFDYDKDSWKL